jgi:hypothetical protein
MCLVLEIIDEQKKKYQKKISCSVKSSIFWDYKMWEQIKWI